MAHNHILPLAESPETAGISSQGLLDFLDGLQERGLELHGLIILRQGQVAAQMAWQPYDLLRPHTLFSLSKSFASCAAGFAVAEGLLSYDSPVAQVLKHKLPRQPHPLLGSITLHHLLCMGSGLDPRSDQGARKTRDFAKHILSYPVVHQPGSHFHYNSMSSYLVSAMVQQVTGQTCRDYLMPRLFDKLGIAKPQWDCCPLGVNLGGFGLHLSTTDIAKFGQLLLADGIWQGEQVLPQGWVQRASARQIDNSANNPDSDWEQGYGYQFWRNRGGRYRGDGLFGQVCMVDEAHELVIACTAGSPDMAALMDLIHQVLVPAVGAPPADPATQQQLQRRIKALAYKLPRHQPGGPDLTGSYLAKGDRRLRLSQLADGTINLSLNNKEGRMPLALTFRPGKPHQGETPLFVVGEHPQAYLGSYAWHQGQLHLSARVLGGPFTFLAQIKPEGKGLHMAMGGAGLPEGSYHFVRQG